MGEMVEVEDNNTIAITEVCSGASIYTASYMSLHSKMLAKRNLY